MVVHWYGSTEMQNLARIARLRYLRFNVPWRSGEPVLAVNRLRTRKRALRIFLLIDCTQGLLGWTASALGGATRRIVTRWLAFFAHVIVNVGVDSTGGVNDISHWWLWLRCFVRLILAGHSLCKQEACPMLACPICTTDSLAGHRARDLGGSCL